jgi:hypothetical protein
MDFWVDSPATKYRSAQQGGRCVAVVNRVTSVLQELCSNALSVQQRLCQYVCLQLLQSSCVFCCWILICFGKLGKWCPCERWVFSMPIIRWVCNSSSEQGCNTHDGQWLTTSLVMMQTCGWRLCKYYPIGQCCHCDKIWQLNMRNNNAAAVVVVSNNDWYLYCTNFHNSFI